MSQPVTYSPNYSANGCVYDDDEEENFFSFQYFINMYRGMSYDWTYHLTMLIMAILLIMIIYWIFAPKRKQTMMQQQPLLYPVR